MNKKCLWVQTYFNGELIEETRVTDLKNYETGEDVAIMGFLNNPCLKLVWK